MGLLDFIFGKKKEARTSMPQPAAKPQTTTSRLTTSASSTTKAVELSIAPFVFESNQHQRYENGNPVKGLQECPRTIKVEKNENGCSGYQLKSGDGYIVRMINGDTGQPQMSAKPMRVIKSTATEVTLRGYMVSVQTPFGFQDIDMADYGLTVSLKDGKLVKCVLHMYDRNVDIEYRQVALKPQQQDQKSMSIPSIKSIADGCNFELNIDGREIVVDTADLKIAQEALIAYEAHDYPTAIAKYSFLIEKNRSAFQYYKFRGTVYEDMGDDNSAFNDFAKAVDLCSTDAVALYRLAMVYHRRKDLRTAIKYLEEAYKYSPTYDNLMGNSHNNILFVHKRVIACNLANFLTQSNRVEEGLKLLDEVISNCPDYSFPYFVKAITLANKGDYKSAASSAEKASALGHPQANALLGQIRAKTTVSNSNDRFSEMVDKASFNPFNITTDKALQNTIPLPDYRNVFARELTNLFSTLNGHMSEDAVVTSYIFNLAESYYNNAGYIPKNSLDDIIESVYSAYQNTSYYNPSITLNDVKYKVYFSLLNRSRPVASASYAPKAAVTGKTPQRLFADKVEKAIIIANQGPKSVQDLQNALFEVYSCINKPGSGKLVTTFHDKQKLAECFMFMLRYDWMHDSDLREVWAENGLYCVVDLIRKGQGDPVEQAQYFMEMFMLLRWGKDSLIPKVQDLLNKSQMRNNPVFDNNDYKNGASYVISQFSFLTINGLRPLAQQDMRIIAGFMEACDGNAYFQECTKLDFYHLNPMIIFEKMKFVATIIGSILDDM